MADEGGPLRVLLIGGTGFIGSVVLERLQEAGHDVAGLARSDAAAATLAARGVRVVRGALADAAVLAAAAREADAVVQVSLAGSTTMIAEQEAEISGALDAVLGALERSGKALVYTSGIGIYGDTGSFAPDLVLTEEDPVAPARYYHFLPEIERRVRAAARRGVRSVLVRPALAYGRRGGWIGPIPRRFACARTHGRVFGLEAGRNLIAHVDVDDLADLYLLALERGAAGEVYNAVSDEVAVRDVAEAVSRIAGFGGGVAPVGIEEQRRLEGWMGPFDFQFALRASSEKARRELGWAPRRPGVLEHLAGLEAEGVSIAEVYPGPGLSGTPQ